MAELMHRGRGVFLELIPHEDLRDIAAAWKKRIDLVAAKSDPPLADALLIRPDGYVAWAVSSADSEEASQSSLVSALKMWFGESH